MNANTVESVVEVDGISITKSLDESYTYPAIAYVVTSTRDVETTLRLVEIPPEDVRAEQLGFHSEYGAEYWEFEDGRLVFERDVEPDEEFTTVVGVRDVDEEKVEQLLGDFEEVSVRPEVGAGASIDDSRIPELDDAETQSTDGGRESDEPMERESDEPVDDRATISQGGESASGDGSTTETSAHRDDEREPFTRGGSNGDVPVSVEMGSSRVDDADPVGSSDDARIRQLQNEVADLRSYTAALEEFLDENGSARKVLDELDEKLGSVQADVGRIEATVESHDDGLTRLEDDVSGLVDELGDHQSQIEAFDERLADVEAELNAVDDLAELAERLSKVEAWRSSMRDAFVDDDGGNDVASPTE